MRIIEAIAMGFMLSQITDNLPSLIYFGISHAKCTTINWPAHSPRSAFTFCLIKKQQKIKSAKRLLCRTGLCPANRAEPRAGIFCPTPFTLAPASAKFPMPLPRSKPPLFCPLSPEAVLPTEGLRFFFGSPFRG
jgi:hypothetical protein